MPCPTDAAIIEGYERHNAVIERVAADAGVLFMDTREAQAPAAANYGDSIHVNAAGYRLLAAQVSAALRRTWRERRR